MNGLKENLHGTVCFWEAKFYFALIELTHAFGENYLESLIYLLIHIISEFL